MLVEEELARISPQQDMLLTIGVFDGVHSGHKHLLAQLTRQASQQDLLSGVVTFRQHPQAILAPHLKMPFLTDFDQRIALLKAESIDIIIPLTFSSELAGIGARQFIILLIKYAKMRGLVIGPDFALGQSRKGNITALHQLGQTMNFSVTVIPPFKLAGKIASSTAIRKALAQGNMSQANRLIGRPFSIRGQVISGSGRGTRLGFPTANLDVDPEQALPKEGVYATLTHLNDKTLASVTNIGRRPTFGGHQRTIETHIPDFQDNLYGRDLRIDFIERLRAERKFNTEQELQQQLIKDINRGKSILSSPGQKLIRVR